MHHQPAPAARRATHRGTRLVATAAAALLYCASLWEHDTWFHGPWITHPAPARVTRVVLEIESGRHPGAGAIFGIAVRVVRR